MDIGNPAALGPRQMRNCQPCKQRKIKCDRKIPCGPCALRGNGRSCTSAAAIQMGDQVDTASATYVSLLQFQELSRQVRALGARVHELEGALGKAGGQGLGFEERDVGSVNQQDDGSASGSKSWHNEGTHHESFASTSQPTPGSKRPSRTSPPPDVASGTAASPITARRHMADDEMVFALEDYQMSRTVNTVHNLDDRERVGSTGPEFSPTNAESPNAADADAGKINDRHPLAFIISPNTNYLAHAIASLPEQQVCEVLVQRYFDNVEWFQRCLHYPTFIKQCRQFWADSSGGALASSPDFVCTYLMVVCLGLAFSESPSDTVDLLALAERLYHVAEGVLWCSRFLHRQTFESLQAISLMTIYGYGMEDSADATWALSGSAIKIAQNLGMNRLDAEKPNKVWATGWTSRLKREMARRVWWNLVYLDWSHAMAHGSTYAIHPSQNLTVLPSNFDDDQLDDPSALPHPLDVYTPINKHIFLFKFAMLYRQITDHMASQQTSYAFILEMDDAIIELASNLPPHFADPAELPVEANSTLLIDSILVHLTANIRLVRLHRSFFLRGYHDKHYERSMSRCVKSAHTILRLLDLAKQRCPVLLNFWIILFYAFTAAVPVCVDLLYAPTEDKHEAVQQILQTFRERSAVSPAARKSVYVLESLLNAQHEFRTTQSAELPPQKRQRNGRSTLPSNRRNDLLKATIKGILQSADLNGPPPTPSTSSGGFGFSPLFGGHASEHAANTAPAEPASNPVDPAALAILDAAGVGWGGLDSAWNFPIDIFQDLWTENGWNTQH